MKSAIYTVLLIFSFQLYSCSDIEDPTRFMTYNIKYDNKNDSINNWNLRKEEMVSLIMESAPDFLGIQEGLRDQVVYLDHELKAYSFIGVGRDDGKEKGEYAAIFYQPDNYQVIESGTFWLSDTPDRPSVGWDASMERICTYGLFENRNTKTKAWVFNTHFDHIGVNARAQSAALILRKIALLNQNAVPVVLMGDFNLTPDQKPISEITKVLSDGLQISKNPNSGPKGTFNGFDNRPIENRIDYIFVQGLQIASYEHVDKRLESGLHISDHLPILAIEAQ